MNSRETGETKRVLGLNFCLTFCLGRLGSKGKGSQKGLCQRTVMDSIVKVLRESLGSREDMEFWQ